MNSTINQLLAMARKSVNKQASAEKKAFVDPATASGGGGDPMASAAAAGMPMDPMAMGGGGGMPMDPAAMGGGGGGGISAEEIRSIIKNELAASGMGGGGAGGMEPIKPKIDVNVELMMIKKMLARIVDAMGIQIPATDMAATSQDLTQMAMDQQSPADPMAAAGGAPAGGGGAGPLNVAPELVPPAAGGGSQKSSSSMDAIVAQADALKRIFAKSIQAGEAA